VCARAREYAAKKHHPDLNPGDVRAAERFKQMTNAYSQALLAATKREKQGPKTSAADQARYRMRAAAAGSPRASTWGGSRNDSSRFDHREWDKAHYGLHGATAEARQSEYVRNLANAQRMRAAAAGAARARRQQAGAKVRSGGSFTLFLGSLLACVTVWRAVYQSVPTNNNPNANSLRQQTRRK
jgi:hypothetical protein